jgi:hypothetical protein
LALLLQPLESATPSSTTLKTSICPFRISSSEPYRRLILRAHGAGAALGARLQELRGEQCGALSAMCGAHQAPAMLNALAADRSHFLGRK